VGDLLVLLLVVHDSGCELDRVGAVSVGSRPLLRRTTLALAAAGGLVVVAGCDDGDERPAPAPSPSPSPDTALVDRVLIELAGAERVASAAGELELAALHRAHIEALDGTPPTHEPGRTASKDAVDRREQRLQTHLVAAAVAAESGELARLIASMSAAVAQRQVSR
jgi:hypothetical protein